jgi:hypothetical protein
MQTQDLARECYEWQINNLKFERWARTLREEVDEIRLAYIWQSQWKDIVGYVK